MTCKICEFYRATTSEAGQQHASGTCRRYPPVPLAVPGQPLGFPYLPIVTEDFWCGEFVQRFEQQEAPQEPRAPDRQGPGLAIIKEPLDIEKFSPLGARWNSIPAQKIGDLAEDEDHNQWLLERTGYRLVHSREQWLKEMEEAAAEDGRREDARHEEKEGC